MKKLSIFILLIYSCTSFSQMDRLQAKWISETETVDGEILSYEFFTDNSLKIFVDGNELPTEEPIGYAITETNGMLEIEIEYSSPWNDSVEKMAGLIEFIEKDKIRMEFFPFDEQVGKKNEFSAEAMIFRRE